MARIEEASGRNVRPLFDLSGRVAIITGGSGLLGVRHAQAIAEMGGIPVLVDIDGEQAQERSAEIAKAYGVNALGISADITKTEAVSKILADTIESYGQVDVLINNASNNPKIQAMEGSFPVTRFEKFPLWMWNEDIAVGLTGAFLCSQIIGSEMARGSKGVILNIASDLGVIAPDQRIYRQPGLPDEQQPVKPVSYSIVKHGLIGLTRYLATYWADRGVRVNALSPGGVYTGQDKAFVKRLTNLVPLGRMAKEDEYKAAVVFLVSDASSYMTGANVIIDGGRTTW